MTENNKAGNEVIIPLGKKWTAKAKTGLVILTYFAVIAKETERAVLLKMRVRKENIPDGYWVTEGSVEEREHEFWLPKSQLTKITSDKYEGYIIPSWLKTRATPEEIIFPRVDEKPVEDYWEVVIENEME